MLTTMNFKSQACILADPATPATVELSFKSSAPHCRKAEEGPIIKNREFSPGVENWQTDYSIGFGTLNL